LNYYGIYPHTEIIEMDQANLRKTNTNTEIYVKNPKETNHGERERFYDNVDNYNGVSLVY